MTASDPDTPGDPKDSILQFPVVLRGYERHLVDTRLAELLDQFDQQRRRADEAEQALQHLRQDMKEGLQLPEWFASVGAEVRQVGEQAPWPPNSCWPGPARAPRRPSMEPRPRQPTGGRRPRNKPATSRTPPGTRWPRPRLSGNASTRVATAAAERLIADADTRAQEAMDTAAAQAAARLRATEEQAGNLERSAHETLAQALAERVRIQAEATAGAEELRARAERDATAILDKAQEEATLAWQKAARERVLLEAEAERLTTMRQRMVEQLGQVYAPLGLTLVDTRPEREPGDQGEGQASTDEPRTLPAAAEHKQQEPPNQPDQPQ
jgi:hypothetical protein